MPLDSTHVGATNQLSTQFSPLVNLTHTVIGQKNDTSLQREFEDGFERCKMSGESERVWRGVVDDLLALADFCEINSPLDYHFVYKRISQLREDVANAADNFGCTINGRIWVKFDEAQSVIQ